MALSSFIASRQANRRLPPLWLALCLVSPLNQALARPPSLQSTEPTNRYPRQSTLPGILPPPARPPVQPAVVPIAPTTPPRCAQPAGAQNLNELPTVRQLIAFNSARTGFLPERDALAFQNYGANASPEMEAYASAARRRAGATIGTLGVAHCTTMARFARTVQERTHFYPPSPSTPQRPGGASSRIQRGPPESYRGWIRAMVQFDGTLPRLSNPRHIPLYGYSNLRELSTDTALQRIIAEEFGDAIGDFLNHRGNPGWSPINNLTVQTRSLDGERAELLRVLRALGQGDASIFYIIGRTTQSNHVLLAFAAERVNTTLELYVWDPNHGPQMDLMRFDICSGQWAPYVTGGDLYEHPHLWPLWTRSE